MVETAEAVSSPAPIAVDLGALVNLTADERVEFRKTGELPKKPVETKELPVKEESAPSTESSESETAGEQAPPKTTQETKRTERYRHPPQ